MGYSRQQLKWKDKELYHGKKLLAWMSKDNQYNHMFWIEGIADSLFSEDYYNIARARQHAETLVLRYLEETNNEEKEA